MTVIFKDYVYYLLCAKHFLGLSARYKAELSVFHYFKEAGVFTDEWCHKAKRYKIENFYPLDKHLKINDGQNKMKGHLLK